MTAYGPIQVRRGTTAQWLASNRVLLPGEFGYDTDTGDLKIGTGVDNWTNLAVIGEIDEALVSAAVADYLADNPPVSGYVHTQSVALSSWVITHPLGRIPNVAVYLGGVAVDADVAATSATATVTFPSPTAGIAVLS